MARTTSRSYVAWLSAAALAGLAPIAFNLVVDPYERNALVDLGLSKQKVGEKAHYPLWKMTHYPRDGAALIVLGDSRARALRDKYWREAGRADAYNFAYGGANIDEIHATFRRVAAETRLKTLIVGVQLRSFDTDHKAGLNRVPEAIALNDNPLAYYSSWFVAKIGWRTLLADKDVSAWLDAATPRLISRAKASEGLLTQSCDACALPAPLALRPAKGPNLRLGRGGLGAWSAFYAVSIAPRALPPAFRRQVVKNARSDWKAFRFSPALWAKIVAIADWCAANDVELRFVIPPTIVEMQKTIADYGLAAENHTLRIRLAALAPVIDFDFDNPITRDLENFNDAYHFDAGVARRMVEEIVRLLAPKPRPGPDSGLLCPARASEARRRRADAAVRMTEGRGCRIWSIGHAR